MMPEIVWIGREKGRRWKNGRNKILPAMKKRKKIKDGNGYKNWVIADDRVCDDLIS